MLASVLSLKLKSTGSRCLSFVPQALPVSVMKNAPTRELRIHVPLKVCSYFNKQDGERGQTEKYFHRVKLEKSAFIIHKQFLRKICPPCAAVETHGSLSCSPRTTELRQPVRTEARVSHLCPLEAFPSPPGWVLLAETLLRSSQETSTECLSPLDKHLSPRRVPQGQQLQSLLRVAPRGKVAQPWRVGGQMCLPQRIYKKRQL